MLRRFALFNYNRWEYDCTLIQVVYWPQDMSDAVQPILEHLNAERCPRCLQPVPPKAYRCPGCRQPIHSLRFLRLVPFAIGVAGLLAMAFVMLVLYRTVRNEDSANAPVPVDEKTAEQQQLFPDPAAKGNTKRPAKPEKRPPLNER